MMCRQMSSRSRSDLSARCQSRDLLGSWRRWKHERSEARAFAQICATSNRASNHAPIVAEGRLDCLADGQKAEEEEGGDADGERRRPAEDGLELERQEEQVCGVSSVDAVDGQIVVACSRWKRYASGRAEDRQSTSSIANARVEMIFSSAVRSELNFATLASIALHVGTSRTCRRCSVAMKAEK